MLVAGAALRYYDVYWSTWLISEFVRKRTEWIANRAVKEGCAITELRQRQRESRARVDVAVAEMSRVFKLVDYTRVPTTDLGWLTDPNDWPVMQTALVARAVFLVTENTRDFPTGETRNAMRIVTTHDFLTAIYTRFTRAEADIRAYLD